MIFSCPRHIFFVNYYMSPQAANAVLQGGSWNFNNLGCTQFLYGQSMPSYILIVTYDWFWFVSCDIHAGVSCLFPVWPNIITDCVNLWLCSRAVSPVLPGLVLIVFVGGTCYRIYFFSIWNYLGHVIRLEHGIFSVKFAMNLSRPHLEHGTPPPPLYKNWIVFYKFLQIHVFQRGPWFLMPKRLRDAFAYFGFEYRLCGLVAWLLKRCLWKVTRHVTRHVTRSRHCRRDWTQKACWSPPSEGLGDQCWWLLWRRENAREQRVWPDALDDTLHQPVISTALALFV